MFDGPVLACDLFAGAGGFTLGAYLAGVSVVAAVENNVHACATYASNLIDSGLVDAVLFDTDVQKLDASKLVERSRFAQEDCDILLGGPPCQGFSSHRLNGAGIDDPRNGLLLRYFEYVRTLRPLFFLVENVPGLLWPRHAAFLRTFAEYADRADYALLEPTILNARDYGVPQNRRRVFLLGYDRTRVAATPRWPPRPTFGPPGNEEGLPAWRTAAVAFRSPAPVEDPNDVHMKHGDALLKAFRKTPPNGGSRRDSGRVLPCHRSHVGHHDVYGRIDPTVPAPTMTTACINPSKGRFVHPTEHHGITLRQAARLQSFPDWFVFEGGLMAGGVQVGNAVPIGLARSVVAPLHEAVLAYRTQLSSRPAERAA